MNNAVVSLRHHGELTPPHPGDELVAMSVGPSGEAVALWSTAAGQTTLLGRVPERPPVPARIATYWPDPGPVVEIADFDLAFPIPAPMPDGRVLAVASRCRWWPGGADPNAVIFDDAGVRVGEGVVGDGIEHMFTTWSLRPSSSSITTTSNAALSFRVSRGRRLGCWRWHVRGLGWCRPWGGLRADRRV